jgi:hypothetical protein
MPAWTARASQTASKQQRCFKGHGFLHLAYARASDRRLVLGQEAVAGKASEIAESQLLLEWRELAGAQVAIEAMACQARIARAIPAWQADLSAGRDDQLAFAPGRDRTLRGRRAALGGRPARDRRRRPSRIEGGQNLVTLHVAWLTGDRCPGGPRFPSLARRPGYLGSAQSQVKPQESYVGPRIAGNSAAFHPQSGSCDCPESSPGDLQRLVRAAGKVQSVAAV